MQSSMPISLAVVDSVPEDVPPEIFHLPEMSFKESQIEHVVDCFSMVTGDNVSSSSKTGVNQHSVLSRLRLSLRNSLGIRSEPVSVKPEHPPVGTMVESHMHESLSHLASGSFSHDIHFASSGTCGIVDLGASQTVIGSHQVRNFCRVFQKRSNRELSEHHVA